MVEALGRNHAAAGELLGAGVIEPRLLELGLGERHRAVGRADGCSRLIHAVDRACQLRLGAAQPDAVLGGIELGEELPAAHLPVLVDQQPRDRTGDPRRHLGDVGMHVGVVGLHVRPREHPPASAHDQDRRHDDDADTDQESFPRRAHGALSPSAPVTRSSCTRASASA